MPTGPFCDGCSQQHTGVRFIPADGGDASGLLFVGEGPWTTEVHDGRNFVGSSGNLYDRWLQGIGESRETVITANSVWCKAPRLGYFDDLGHNREAFAVMAHCRPNLDVLVERIKPKVIVPMGGVALRRVTDLAGIQRNHSYICETPYGVPAVPTFHPSFVMQGNRKFGLAVQMALERAKMVAAGRYHKTPTTLLVDPAPMDLTSYLSRFPADLDEITVDIETQGSGDIDEDDEKGEGASYDIFRAGFSLEQGFGVSFPWEPPYVYILRNLVRRSKLVWEWTDKRFDSRRLEAQGFKPGGQWMSAMWCWHHLESDLPKALAFVAPWFYFGPPWKHLSGVAPGYYSAMDNLVQHLVLLGCRERLREQGRWEAFAERRIRLDPILVRAGNAGIQLDQERHQEFVATLQTEHKELLAKLDASVPLGVKPVKRWKREPKDSTGVTCSMVVCECGGGNPRCRGCKGSGERHSWERTLPFNPESHVQVKALIRALKLPVPMDRREGRETTAAPRLLALARRHPIFKTLLEARERETLLTMYDWHVDERGRVTTTYNYNPTTGRKASEKPNLQNIPKRSDLAKRFRRAIVAAPGCVLVEADSSAIEAVLVGWLAGSETYVRLAKLGVHDWLTALKVGEVILLDAPDDEFRQRTSMVKQRHGGLREAIKRVVHASNYLAKPNHIAEIYPEYFNSVKDATELQNLYFSTEPGRDVRRYHKSTLTIANRDHVLKTPFGDWHYFWHVFNYESRMGVHSLGEDAKRSVASRPQSMASAIQDLIILWWADHEPRMLDYLRMITHDSTTMEVPEDAKMVDEVVKLCRAAYTQPWPQLPFPGYPDGLTIGCEVSVGRNLANKSDDNPDGMEVVLVA